MLDTAGKQVNAGEAMARFARVEPSGNVRSQTFKIWIFKGVDAKGYPIYEFPAPRSSPSPRRPWSALTTSRPRSIRTASRKTRSPPTARCWSRSRRRDSPHGTGLSNSGGVDVARFRKDGTLRWYLPMNDFGPIQGVKQVTPGFILTSWGHQAEWIGLDEDGLSLGHLGFPREAHWSGYWVDHPDQHVLFQGNDGKLHVLVGDYFLNGDHWLSLRNYDNYRKAAYPFAVTAGPRGGAGGAAAPHHVPAGPCRKTARDGEETAAAAADRRRPGEVAADRPDAADHHHPGHRQLPTSPAPRIAAPWSAWPTKATTSTSRCCASTTCRPSTRPSPRARTSRIPWR